MNKIIKKTVAEIVPVKQSWKNYYEEEIKYLKESELLTLFNGISNEFHLMICLFLFETGSRVSEALQVKLSDFDFKQNTVRLITLKRRNKNIVRVLSLSDSLINKILLYEKSKQLLNSDYLFTRKTGQRHISVQAVNQMIKDNFVEILGERYRPMGHPHTLRHSRAIQLLNSGVNIMHVKTILGHANIMNTLVYLKYSNRDIQESIRKSNLSLGIK